jgi:hypothetical protein
VIILELLSCILIQCSTHVAIDFHFIQDQVQTSSLRVAHVSSDNQLVDALTKSLPLFPWSILREHIR